MTLRSEMRGLSTACGAANTNTHTLRATRHSQLNCSQSVAEADVCGGLHDAEAGSVGVPGRSGLTFHQLKVEVEQQQTQELFDPVDGEVASGTLGGAGAERHAVILQLLSVFVEVRLLFAVLHETVEPERLMVQRQQQ